MKKCPYAYQLCTLTEGCVYPDPGKSWDRLRNVAAAARSCSAAGVQVRIGEYNAMTVDEIVRRREDEPGRRRRPPRQGADPVREQAL